MLTNRTRSSLLYVLSASMLLSACGDDGGGDGATEGMGGTDAGSSTTSAEATNPTNVTDPSEGTTTDPSEGTTSVTGTGGADSGSGSGTDATDPTDPTDPSSGGEEGGGSIDVTLTGCDVDFGGTVVVTYNGSLGVASVYDSGATLSGSFQFDLDGSTGDMELSTQHRIDTNNVVNMVDTGQGTWTNIDGAASGSGVDRISGTLTIDVWDPSEGRAELAFDGVTLVNIVSDTVCTIDGTITTASLYP